MTRRNGTPLPSGRRFAGFVVLGLVLAGCGGRESAKQAAERRTKESREPAPILAKFSGTVTIDNRPPAVEPRHALLLMLYDPRSPPTEANPPRYAIVQNDGTFNFGQGGVPPGPYIALFAELLRGRPGTFRGPDVLKNLYNDPEQNQTVDSLRVELPIAGKTQNFNLEIAEKEPVNPHKGHSIVQLVAPAQ